MFGLNGLPESYLTCSTLVSAPASSTRSCEGSRQPWLGAQGACSWQRSHHGTAPGDEIPLSTPCVRREACLPCQLARLGPQLCFTHLPSPFSLLQNGWWVAMGPACRWLSGRGKSPCSASAAWRPRCRDRGESPPLHAVRPAAFPVVSKYL